MKLLRFPGAAAAALCLSLCFTACSNDDDNAPQSLTPEQQQAELLTHFLGMTEGVATETLYMQNPETDATPTNVDKSETNKVSISRNGDKLIIYNASDGGRLEFWISIPIGNITKEEDVLEIRASESELLEFLTEGKRHSEDSKLFPIILRRDLKRNSLELTYGLEEIAYYTVSAKFNEKAKPVEVGQSLYVPGTRAAVGYTRAATRSIMLSGVQPVYIKFTGNDFKAKLAAFAFHPEGNAYLKFTDMGNVSIKVQPCGPNGEETIEDFETLAMVTYQLALGSMPKGMQFTDVQCKLRGSAVVDARPGRNTVDAKKRATSGGTAIPEWLQKLIGLGDLHSDTATFLPESSVDKILLKFNLPLDFTAEISPAQ